MYTLKQKQIPLCENYDVIVVGGGPSGCTAAASAAREGAKTLLIEATGSLGGMGTSGLVPAWCPFSDKEKLVYRGMAEKVFNLSKKSAVHVQEKDVDWVPIDSEALKRIYDSLEEEYGVTVLFNTLLSDVESDEDGNVKAIIVTNKAGLNAYKAKVYIDCTGDADLAVWAGAKYSIGENGGEPMASTLCFMLSNVDIYAFLYAPNYGVAQGSMHSGNLKSFVHKLADDERFPHIVDAHLCSNIVGPGTIGFNAGHIFNVDSTDPNSVSRSLIEGRKMAIEFRNAFASYFPEAFANAFLVSTAPSMGIRESRRIEGDYILTADDYAKRATFTDEICRNSYYLDIHPTKEDHAHKAFHSIDEDNKRSQRYAPGESHGIPYRSLLPKNLTNVLVAGRSISCDKRIQGSIRVMPVCLAMGEAAGMAAAHAAVNDCNVHNVNVEHLRTRLLEEGAYLL